MARSSVFCLSGGQSVWTGRGNRLSAYSYDAAGNVMNDGVNQYLYDAEDRVCAVKSDTTGAMTGYIYDGAGDRVGKGTITSFSCNLSSNGFVATSGYVVGLSGEQLTETNGGTGWVHTHVYANGKLLATYTSSDTLFELSDWLGTKRADVGVSGCETTWQSLPFGDGLTSSGNCSDSSELHFTGKERDAESGNDYFGARYYASNMGRFLTPDWAAKAVTVPYASFGDPQTLNLYVYVENGPLNRVDADGHMSQPPGYGSTLMGPRCGSAAADMILCDSGGSPFGLDYSAAEANYDAAYVAQVEWVSASTGNKAAQPAQAQQQNSGEGSSSNVDKRNALADAAYDEAKNRSTNWAQGNGAPKCNVFVCAMLNKVGIGGPTYPGGDNPLVAQDWANPKFKVDNWRVLGPGEAPQAGDVAAYKESFSNATGHSGIVTGNENGTIRVVAAGSRSIYQTTAGSKYFGQGMVITYRRYTGP
ncbi:MAG TPA: RHS repeat-associated core domain-containing protein [Acidobacteriaceae bacterium]|nr:RHS repeat-associated core domain-containing protein [Acidobacteriaceae bacterium]